MEWSVSFKESIPSRSTLIQTIKKTNNKTNKTKQKSKIDVDFKLEDLVQKNKKEENGKAKVIYLLSFFTGFTMHKFQYRLRAKCFAHFFPSWVKWKAPLNKT